MAMIDMTHRKLQLPPRFIPYLEKHRIFELFHECVELLLQVRPRDHIQFLKNVLPCAAMKKDKQRIVFLSPPSFDREVFSQLLADCLGIHSISLSYLEALTKERQQKSELRIESTVESVEEESCICPGESLYIPTMYYPDEQEFVLPESREEELGEEEIMQIEAEADEPPCDCVCPCVKEKEAEQEEGGAVTAQEEEKAEDEKAKEEKAEEEKAEEEKAEEEKVEVKVEVEVEVEESDGDKDEKIKEDNQKERKRKKCKSEVTLHESVEEEEHVWEESISRKTSQSSHVTIDFGLLGDCEVAAKGWILEDFPLTGKDADSLNAIGILPTHALRFILNEEEEAKDTKYQLLVKDWKKSYKYVPVMEIRVKERSLEELIKDMCSLLSLMPHRHAPMLPRIVLIGSRGSGVTTQGQKLALKYGLVHVEYEIVIARALEQDDEISKLYKIQQATRPDPELEAYILEKALLTSACRNRGWVLTGYPRNIDQMRMLDIIATPPNRVIFIEVPAKECFVRLYYRKIDPCSGEEYKIPQVEPYGLDGFKAPNLEPEVVDRLLSHPKNNKKQVIHDIETYFLNKQEMMAYCGKTAFYVDGDKEVDKVFEHIEQIMINPSPPHPPRDPLAINHGIDESLERLKKYRLMPGMLFNNLLLNPPERIVRI